MEDLKDMKMAMELIDRAGIGPEQRSPFAGMARLSLIR